MTKKAPGMNESTALSFFQHRSSGDSIVISNPQVQIPMFDNAVQMRLTKATNCGWDFSKPSTDDESPCTDSFSNSGFFSSRVASWVESSAKPAILCACS